jgi:hypothetical protein
MFISFFLQFLLKKHFTSVFICAIIVIETNSKDYIMVIVKDIQDALTMKNLIEDVIRRADNCSKEHVLIELDMICATLQKNVNLTESEMEIEAQCEV